MSTLAWLSWGLFILIVIVIGIRAVRIDRRREAAKLEEAAREADDFAKVAMRDLARRKTPEKKPAVSPFRVPAKKDGSREPVNCFDCGAKLEDTTPGDGVMRCPRCVPLKAPKPGVVTMAALKASIASRVSYREPVTYTYENPKRYLCVRCNSTFSTRLDPSEIDIYDRCPVCKEKAVCTP